MSSKYILWFSRATSNFVYNCIFEKMNTTITKPYPCQKCENEKIVKYVHEKGKRGKVWAWNRENK